MVGRGAPDPVGGEGWRFRRRVGFALLFPSERHVVPSLWEAVAAGDAEPFATGMDDDEQRVWTWKDELPLRRLAWYGNFVGGRGSFVSPALLRLLYPAYGDEGDHESLDLSPTAHQIAGAAALARCRAQHCAASSAIATATSARRPSCSARC